MLRVALPVVLLAPSLLTGLRAAPDSGFFERQVLPLLERRCFECHSHASKIKGGLALDSRSGWETGGDHGAAIVPGEAERSLLISAVRYTDHDLQMPPKKRLPAEEVALLEQWVRMGAPDPRTGGSTPARRGLDLGEAMKHWAFQPVEDRPFALATGPQADRHTLLRRVSLDLTGLPPTPEEIAAFTGDPSPDAFARVVDRLLASPAFGERWARHWLDLVGYADQIGSANNVPAPHAWRYRDYVIRAFRADKPFDEFIREQVAGDLLASGDTRRRQDQIIATGFLVLGNINIVEADKEKLRADVVDQQIEKIGKAFLGMTLQCVRCHDHKFDPVTQSDYYGLAGIFQSTESVYLTGRGVWSSVHNAPLPETEEDRLARSRSEREHAEETARLAAGKTGAVKRREAIAARLKEGAEPPEREALEKEQGDLEKRIRDLDNRLRHLEYLGPGRALAHAARDSARPGDTRITIRGNPRAPGAVVPRGFVHAAFRGPPPEVPRDQSGRLQLADWLVSPRNTLTARVTVNRIWRHLFGRGIVQPVDYFGLRGGKPSNPALLDHLAARFLALGWSQKRLIREIVLGDAYRQAAGVEQRRFRLDAETIRDAALAVSGDLVACAGGPALALEYPENVSGLDPKNVNPVAFSLTKFRAEQPFQRTIYLPVVRSSAQKGSSEILDIFDFAQPAQMQGERVVTTVAPQALFLMNGPLIRAAAASLAGKLLRSPAADDPARLADLYLRVLNRPITDDESREARAYLCSFGESGSGAGGSSRHGADAWTSLCHALLTCNEFLFRQ